MMELASTVNDGNFRIEEGVQIVWSDGVSHQKPTATNQSIDRLP